MTPVAAAIATVGRAARSFHPRSMPVLSRAHYQRELVAWGLLPVAIGAVEGGVLGVIAKNVYAGVVDPRLLNFAVGILAAAPALANITSFIWAALGHGRHKIRSIVFLQLGAILMVSAVALAPINGTGLGIVLISAVGARVCWSGVTILRSTVWRANYPRSARATLAGKLATVQALVMAAVSAIIGLAMSFDESSFRIAYPLAAIIGLLGVLVYSKLRMRGHRALLAAERTGDAARGGSFNPMEAVRILTGDHRFAKYMLAMFIFGTGNLMVAAPLVIMLKDRFILAGAELSDIWQMVIASTIPLLLMPLTIPIWSRLLDRMHIIQFRAIHCWAFVGSIVAVLIAAVTMQTWMLFVAAALKGVAFGGGVLGWNLGHHDFAPVEKASQYMGVHVTLTGIRGIFGPLAAVAIYETLESLNPGSGGWVFAVCLGLSLIGAVMFVVLARSERLRKDEEWE